MPVLSLIWAEINKTSIAINRTAPVTACYQHNAMGERVNKGGSGSSQTFFLFDPAGRLVGDYLENLATLQSDDWLLQQETVWFGDIPVAVIKPGNQPIDPVQVYMIHADHLNMPRVITDNTGTPVWLWRNQNAFGDNTQNEDPDGDSNLFEYNLRFAGQYFDSETGLHYNHFRDYEPATGRYLSSDPIGLAGGLDTYGYALQNPLKFNDPFGLANVDPSEFYGVGGGMPPSSGVDLNRPRRPGYGMDLIPPNILEKIQQHDLNKKLNEPLLPLPPFENNAFHGEGQFVDDKGKRIVGDWENGELISINDDEKITDE